jgi:hypothetical protein
VGDVVLQWLVSASTCICAQSNREVHRASTSDGISGGQPNRVQPRRTAQKKTTSQFTSSCFGLVHGSGKWHKEHALSNHAKSEPSRVGRDWPVMSTNRKLSSVDGGISPYKSACVYRFLTNRASRFVIKISGYEWDQEMDSAAGSLLLCADGRYVG